MIILIIYILSVVLCFYLLRRYNNLSSTMECDKMDFTPAMCISICPGVNTIFVGITVIVYFGLFFEHIHKTTKYQKINNWFKGKKGY